jgi:transposase-like protein
MGPTKDDARRVFTDEFKQDAVRLVTTDGYTFAAAVKSLGIGE